MALRGGGTKGAYQIGVLKAFIEMMEPIDYAYDVVTGVSIGGINAALIATFPREELKEPLEILEKYWTNLAATDLWSNWPLGIVEGLWR